MTDINQAVARAFARTGRPHSELNAFVDGWNATLDYREDRKRDLTGSNWRPLGILGYMFGGMMLLMYGWLLWESPKFLNPNAWHIVPFGTVFIVLGILAHRKAISSERARAEAFETKWVVS